MGTELLNRLSAKLDKFVAFHSIVKGINYSIDRLYPIAIVESNTFYVFDFDEKDNRYKFIMEHNLRDMKIPDEVRACFPLDFYEGKAAAVVSESALDTAIGNVFIIHEFVHCYQNNDTCEQEIKDRLLIYQESLESRNYMWELNHEFPYDDSIFINKVKELDNNYKVGNEKKVLGFYKSMKAHLRRQDYEYMLWQEWSEGFARYIENKARAFLNLDLNIENLTEPFDRIVFYELGSRHIEYIINNLDKPQIDIEDLYLKMNEND